MSRPLIAPDSAETYLALGHSDQASLRLFVENRIDQTDYLTRCVRERNTSYIVKASHLNPIFAGICGRKEYTELWTKLTKDQLDYLCRRQSTRPLTDDFELNNDITAFDHFRGLFLYTKALMMKDKAPDGLLSPHAASFLAIAATTYRSIHALQAYNEYRYKMIDALPIGDGDHFEEAIALFNAIIADCKAMEAHYGSYASMMLAEAATRTAIYINSLPTKSSKQCQMINHYFDVSKESCDKAREKLSESESLITFASLGRGLSASNSFGFNDPLEASLAINRLRFSGDTSAFTPAAESKPTP